MSDFPPVGMTNKEDTSFFHHTVKDDVMRAETDGGYEFTRPRNTRPPLKIFKTGFTDLTDTERALLQAFYNANRALPFTWTDWTDGAEYTVRFAKPIGFRYIGAGSTRRWNTDPIELKQV